MEDDLSCDSTRSGDSPAGSVAKSGDTPAEGCPSPPTNLFRAGILRQLKEQDWRCAYPCENESGTTVGAKLLPGQPLARAYDNYSLVHLECAKVCDVPSEDNPWSREGSDGEEEAQPKEADGGSGEVE